MMDASYCLKCKRKTKILIRKDLLQKIKDTLLNVHVIYADLKIKIY